MARAEKSRPAATAREIEHIKDLVPDPANRRAHNPRNIGMVVDALHHVGAARSIVIDEENVILAGNGVTEAAAEAGITRVRVVEADGNEIIAVRRRGLSEEQKRALAIYDNRTGELASWNFEQLAADKEAGLSLQPWWTPEEEAALLKSQPKGGLTDPDDVPAERPTDIKLGDLFELGRHRLLCGDSTNAEDVARVMDGQNAGCVLTDPPYGQNQKGVTNDAPELSRELISEAVASIPMNDGVAVFFQSPRTFPLLLDEARANGFTFERMLWFYKAAQCTFPWRGWILKSESILVFSRGTPLWVDVHPFVHDCYYLSEVSEKTSGYSGEGWHGSIKPLSVVSDLLSRIGGQIVYEPFSGTGTTLIACEQHARACYAIEIKPTYVQVAIDRWENFTGQKAVKVGEAVSA